MEQRACFDQSDVFAFLADPATHELREPIVRIEHDGGWAHQVDGTFSETFPSDDLAREAADRAAKEQIVPGEATDISYEDKDGRWHDEASPGGDRPETNIEGRGNFQ